MAAVAHAPCTVSDTIASVPFLLQWQDQHFKLGSSSSLILKGKVEDEQALIDMIADKLNEAAKEHGPNPAGVYRATRYVPFIGIMHRQYMRRTFHGMYSDLEGPIAELNKDLNPRGINLRLMEKLATRFATPEEWTIRVEMEIKM